MSDKNNPKRLERIAEKVEDEAIKEVIVVAAKEIKRQRSRLKDTHVIRESLQGEIVSLKEEQRVLQAKFDRLWEISS